MELDRSPGQVNQLAGALDRVAASVTSASDASDRHARSLVRATWALVLVTIVLGIVTAIGAAGALLLERSPEEQARRDVARCTEEAHIVMSRIALPGRGLSEMDLNGYTVACLNGGQR